MNAFIAGRWDGVNLWLQWDDTAPDLGYQIEVRFRRKAKPGASQTPDWEDWRRTGGLGPYRKAWMVVATHREGDQAQARIAVFGAAEWTPALEAVFLRSTCGFEIRSMNRTVHYLAGTEFHGVVDGAAAVYQLGEEVELQPGESIRVSMEAVDESGFHQLDYPGHFLLRPSLGLTIQNTAPSQNDLAPTGRGLTQLSRLPIGSPLRVAFGATSHFQGGSLPNA